MTGPALCHVFVFVEPGAPEAKLLDDLGLRESYRRDHLGQGTSNVCYCFDNAFLELLWVTDQAAVTSPIIARTGLAERADWQNSGANPFGVALRGGSPAPFSTWDYTPPYLPDGMSIPVALSSDDPTQPLLFMSPGNARPDQWKDGRAGERQLAAGLSEISALELTLAQAVVPSQDLQVFIDLGFVSLIEEQQDAKPKLVLSISQSDGSPDRRLELPSMKWLGTAV